MGRLCPFATRVDLAGRDVRPTPQPEGRIVVSRAFGPRPCKEGLGLGQLPAAASGGRHPSGSPSAQMLRLSGGPDKTLAAGHGAGLKPRPGRGAGLTDAADLAMAMHRPRTESDARGKIRQAKAVLSLPAPASASGSGRLGLATRQLATDVDGAGRYPASQPTGPVGRRRDMLDEYIDRRPFTPINSMGSVADPRARAGRTAASRSISGTGPRPEEAHRRAAVLPHRAAGRRDRWTAPGWLGQERSAWPGCAGSARRAAGSSPRQCGPRMKGHREPARDSAPPLGGRFPGP